MLCEIILGLMGVVVGFFGHQVWKENKSRRALMRAIDESRARAAAQGKDYRRW